MVCANVCEAQPSIKEKLPSTRDVAHMAATALGYLTWGIENNPAKYGLGDLGLASRLVADLGCLSP